MPCSKFINDSFITSTYCDGWPVLDFTVALGQEIIIGPIMALGRELSINHEAQVYTRGDLFGFIMFPDSSANPRTFIRIQCIHLRFRIEDPRKYNQTGKLLPVFWI